MDELTPEQLEELHAALLALKAELEETLRDSEASAGPVELDQARVGRVSRVDAMQQQQMAAAGRRSTENRLTLVRQSLSAYEAGEYGYCKKCEEPIGYPRLKARPEAAYCVECVDSGRHGRRTGSRAGQGSSKGG